ncbi:MAG: hypothetical protein N3A61_03445 [Ignavibacteria bacterium]|nr:hypothetical protein [Ignavibacteria bacterium]
MVIKTRILLFISTFLVLSSFANAQSSLIPLNYKILFEEARDNSFLELTQSEDQVTLKFNGSIKFNSNINSSMRVNFVQSQNRKYSVLILYTFLTKDSKSNFTVNVFDSEFRLVYKKDFEFFYEEPLPIIKITDEGKLIFFTPSEGMIQLIDKDSQTKKFLEEFNFNQERLGTIEIFDDTIFISLSGITDRKYSVTYILDSNLEIISQQNHPFQFVTQYIPFERNKHFISAYNFDDELNPNFSIVTENPI